jgi:hypothetical protein
MVEDNVSASFKGINDTQEAFMVETTDIEAPEPCTHAEAINIEWHTSHPVTQEPSQIGSINPNCPKPFVTPADHSVTLPINQAPVSIIECTIIYNMPYHEAISMPFTAASGPTHSESVKQISFTFLDIPDPPSTHAKANSLVKGSANANDSTAEDRHATSEHTSFIDDGTLS